MAEKKKGPNHHNNNTSIVVNNNGDSPSVNINTNDGSISSSKTNQSHSSNQAGNTAHQSSIPSSSSSSSSSSTKESTPTTISSSSSYPPAIDHQTTNPNRYFESLAIQLTCTLPLPSNDTRRYVLIRTALRHIKEHIPSIIEPLIDDQKEWRLDIQRVAVRPHDKFYTIIFHFDDLGTRTAFFQRVRRVITDEKKGGGHWTFNRRGGSSMYYNGIISTPNLRQDAPIIYECFSDLVKHNQLSHFTFKQVIFPIYEGNTQFSGIGFNVLRSHLRVIGNLPSSIRFQLHERTKTREALSLCKSCHLIISPSDKATHQCVPTCRGCLQPFAAEGKDNDGRCTKKRCIRRYTTEAVCPRCPDGSNLHDPVACPLIQSTKSIDMEEFFSSLESTNYPPNHS